MLTTTVLHGDAALTGLDRCGALVPDQPVTASPLWWRACAAASPTWQPCAVIVQRAGEPVAAAPLAVRGGRTGARVRLLTAGRADDARLPARDARAAEELAAAVAAVLQDLDRWRLELDQLPAADGVLAALGDWLPLRSEPAAARPQAVLDPGRDIVAQLSRNGRKSYRGGLNRLRADGLEPQVLWSRGGAVLAHLPALQQLRRERDHALGRASEMDDAGSRAFHASVLSALATADRLLLVRVLVGDRLAAFDLVVLDGPVARAFDGRVAPGFGRYGLGWLASVEALRGAYAEPGVQVFDWGRGEQENKMRSATRVVPAVRVAAESSPWVACCAALSGAVQEGAADLARRVVPPHRRAALRSALHRAA